MKKRIWLILSGFGIMFAVLSFFQEAHLIPSVDQLGWRKGLFALISGYVLYLACKSKL